MHHSVIYVYYLNDLFVEIDVLLATNSESYIEHADTKMYKENRICVHGGSKM